ncbi:MAG: MarR family transcriptional regulator [Myxococcales bacterium]|nr:MarR family transcriptional regulator [Myxococcales bacterium]
MKQQRIPLARLMAMAFRTQIDQLHATLEERGYHDARPAFGFVLLAADRRPCTINDVAELLGVSKQAASKLVAAMVDAKLVALVSDAEDARKKRIALASRGSALLAEVEAIYRQQEARWARVVTRARLEAMRADLTAILLAEHEGALPAVKPTW